MADKPELTPEEQAERARMGRREFLIYTWGASLGLFDSGVRCFELPVYVSSFPRG